MAYLKPLYPPNHEFTDQELRVWRRMIKSMGCTDITPYKRQESKVSIFELNNYIFIKKN